MAELPHQFSGKRTQCPDNPEEYMLISQVMTQTIIPNAVKELETCNYRDVHLYLMKIIALQSFYCICGIFWIIDLNLRCKHTHEKLYAVAEQLKFPIRGYTWCLKDKLFTKKDVYVLTASTKLPNVIMNADIGEYIKKIQGVNLYKMKQFINSVNKKWFMKQSWQNQKKIEMIINTKQCNSAERRYHIRKENFVEILNNAAAKPVHLIHILVVDAKIKCGYAIDALWKVQIDHNLSIGISFRYFAKNIIKPNAIYVSVAIMTIYSVLSAQPCGKFFDAWNITWNNILVGDRKNIYSETALQQDLRKTQDALKRAEEHLRRAYEEIQARSRAENTMLMQINDYSFKMHILRRNNDILMKWRDDVQKFYPNEYETLAKKTMSREVKTFQHSIANSKDIARKLIALPNSKDIVEKLIKDCAIDAQFLKGIQDDEEKNNENENIDLCMVYNQVNNGSLQSQTSTSVDSKSSAFTFPMPSWPKTNK